jgi:hypothetical protein
MTTETFIRTQIERFAYHSGIAPTPEGVSAQINELLIAFQSSCSTNTIVKAVADQIMKTVKYYPVPAHVWEAAEYLTEHETDSESAERAMRQLREDDKNIAASEKAYYEMALAMKRAEKGARG